MDLVKNGIAISYLFFLVLSLFPPEPRLSSWWFNYHVQYYGILCAIPCLVFCLLQFIVGARLEARGKEKVPFPRKKRFTLSAATAVPVFLVLLGAERLFQAQLEQLMFYVSLFLTCLLYTSPSPRD